MLRLCCDCLLCRELRVVSLHYFEGREKLHEIKFVSGRWRVGGANADVHR